MPGSRQVPPTGLAAGRSTEKPTSSMPATDAGLENYPKQNQYSNTATPYGSCPTPTVAVTVFVAVSITVTVSSPSFVTYIRL